jgi:mannose-6-phosphate isomerase-like protein (cupin superfamily)
MELKEAAETIRKEIERRGFSMVRFDLNRPWGGFFALHEEDAPAFVDAYFPGYSLDELLLGGKLSPKYLMVNPEKRLSWQYHHRRAELWRVLQGPVWVASSPSNEEPAPECYQPGEVITLPVEMRHRLIGGAHVGIVAEIWQHTMPHHPSDEEDIVRLQDDFGRSA